MHDHIGTLPTLRLFLAIAIERQDVQVVQAGNHSHFVLEALEYLLYVCWIGIVGGIRAYNLDCDLLSNHRVSC